MGDSGSPQQPTIFSSSALSGLIRPADLTHILPTKSDLGSLCGAFFFFFFGFKHQKAEAWEGNGHALAHFYYQNYVWTRGCACLHGSVAACRFHLVAKRLYSISKTHGNTIKCVTSFICFHMLSVTPASTPCLMDFQMQVDDFFQDLTGILLLCSQMEIRHEWFFWRWGKILHTEYKHFPWSCLKRPNVMLHAHFHILPNKRGVKATLKYSVLREFSSSFFCFFLKDVSFQYKATKGSLK